MLSFAEQALVRAHARVQPEGGALAPEQPKVVEALQPIIWLQSNQIVAPQAIE